MFIGSQEVIAFVRAALECSVYVTPLDPGLSVDELMEVGKRANYQEGELSDALRLAAVRYFNSGRMQPDPTYAMWESFMFRDDPDYRNLAAFDVVYEEFNRLVRSQGGAGAKLERRVLVERASTNISRHDVEVAITILLLTEQLVEKDKLLSRPHGGIYAPLPSVQRRDARGGVIPRPMRARAYPLVKDVVERRSDGRPRQTEPLDAFADTLTSLGYGNFRLWWKQTVSEMQWCDPASCPTTICILAAALVEGALTFVVKHAHAGELAVLGSKTFDGDPRTWKIDDLVASAARGGESAILDDSTRGRADRLIRLRQRIHAGRMLSDYPGGPPDLRPEEAREARESAEIIVRAVLDWLDRYPAVRPGSP
jgi:hypothetical protein